MARRIYDVDPALLQSLDRTAVVGDIVLVSRAGEAVRPIVYFQNRFPAFPPASRKFTHCALSLGRGLWIHAMPDPGLAGLFSGHVDTVVTSQLIDLGATIALLRAPVLTDDLRHDLAQAARAHLNAPYDYRAILKCLAGVFGWPLKSRSLPDKQWSATSPTASDVAKAFICSDFIYAVFDEMFQERNPCNLPGGNPAPIYLPCALYASPHFNDALISTP
jgi:hypothetical protein